VDSEFKAFIARCISLTSASAERSSRNLLATPLINIWKMILEYMRNSYEVVDEEIVEDLKYSMYKSYALVCGNNIAFCSLGSSKGPVGKYERLHASLIGGT
jgi:hypothetical protein